MELFEKAVEHTTQIFAAGHQVSEIIARLKQETEEIDLYLFDDMVTRGIEFNFEPQASRKMSLSM